MAFPTPQFLQKAPDAPGIGSAAIDVSSADYVPTGSYPRSLYVEAAGAVKFDAVDGSTDTWNVPANFLIPVAVTKVYHTGTTATGIHAIF